MCEPVVDKPDMHGAAAGGWIDWDPSEMEVDNWEGTDDCCLDGIFYDVGDIGAC